MSASSSSPQPTPDPAPGAGEEVLLAFIELAREQAAELARQNDELRRQNDELALANRHKTEFLTTISHELRTPLSAILGYSELLAEGIAGPLTGGQSEYVGDIQRAGENLLALINDLLDMAKIDAGRMDVRRELLDLAVPVADAAELVRSMALRKQQRLELDVASPVACTGDAHRLRQIALNLLSNAVKFTPAGGLVRVTVRADGDRALLEVRDSGIGIDPAFHATIFEAFRQIDAGETRRYEGTGLGLALVRRFCDAMRGEVSVESERGGGATFRVRLPGPGVAHGRVLGLCGGGRDLRSLRQPLVEAGFTLDDLGPEDALLVRQGSCAVLLALPTPEAARAARRIRQQAGEAMPVLALADLAAPADLLRSADIQPVEAPDAALVRALVDRAGATGRSAGR